ncbi:MAG: LPS export ABC transporter permease LptG [Alphaproteobacteria bacterium]|nr:LPS export ABC transporter permease LptG [Alphaproteobacteria bacterium]
MQVSATLSRYIGRQFLYGFLAVLVLLITLTLFIDIIELLRRSAVREAVTMGDVFGMALLKMPEMAQEVTPFAILFSGLFIFWRLARSHELVVIRGAGISAWQFLLPVLVVAIGVGIFKITVFSPLASTMLSRYELLENKLLRGRSSLLAVSSSGLWLRQANENDQSVIHAQHISQNDMSLQDVTIFLFEGADRFASRIDAKSARLQKGHWQLEEAWLTSPDHPAKFAGSHRVKTDLTLEKIQDSFASPETLSFWELPVFIDTLEKAGFSARRHRMHWHSLLAEPLLFCSMVLIAATFMLRRNRTTNNAALIAMAAMAGFLLFFLSDLVHALGLSEKLPVILAAWTPAGVTTLLALAMLLHLEDG